MRLLFRRDLRHQQDGGKRSITQPGAASTRRAILTQRFRRKDRRVAAVPNRLRQATRRRRPVQFYHAHNGVAATAKQREAAAAGAEFRACVALDEPYGGLAAACNAMAL